MIKPRIYLSAPDFKDSKLTFDVGNMSSILTSENTIATFEKGIQKILDTDKSVAAFNSGTAAIHLALILAGVEKGDEVLCQSFTFSATANPIRYQGAIPVFIDSERDTWNICPKLVVKAIEERARIGKKPKAILVVHAYGMPAKMDEISSISKKYDIPLIEDAAESLGSDYQKNKCGTFGDYGIISFNRNKIITTFGGGVLICKNEVVKNKAVFLATQAREEATHYEHREIGYNYRMNYLAAELGNIQINNIENNIAARKNNFQFYKQELEKYSQFKFLEEPDNSFSNRWLSCLLVTSTKLRDDILLELENENIEARPLWKPMHLQPVFNEYPSYTNGVSETLFDTGICLPSGSNLHRKDLRRVIETIKKCIFKKAQ